MNIPGLHRLVLTVCGGMALAACGALPAFASPEMRVAARAHDRSFALSWNSLGAEYRYTVQFRRAVAGGAWENAAGNWPVAGTEWTGALAASERAGFYRVVAEVAELHLPLLSLDQLSDADRDGLSAHQEQLLGTNPADPDTDKDGLLDGYEVFLRYSPAYAAFGADPLRRDSNGDSLDDYTEIRAFVNGFALPDTGLLDSDGDGLTDRQEAVLRTKRDRADSDGDGVSDRIELMQGGNPLNPADGGHGRHYAQFGSREQMHYLTDPGLTGTGLDTLKAVIGYVQPPAARPWDVSGPRSLAAPGNPPIGTGTEGREVFMAFIVNLRDGTRAAVVPRNVCPTGLIRLCPQILQQEQVRLPDGRVITMTTIIPFDRIPLQVLQQCCVNNTGVVDPESVLGALAELFGRDAEVLQAVANYVLKHGLLVFDLEDRDRMFATRLKLTRCCAMDTTSATAIATAIMVLVNLDGIATELVLQLLPAKLGELISVADRALLSGMINDFTDGLISDQAFTLFLCDLVMKYLCPGRVRPPPPGCEDAGEAVPGAHTPGRPPGSGSPNPGAPDEGNPDEPVGHSVPPPYEQDSGPGNEAGNRPPPGGAGDREAGQKDSEGQDKGIAGGKGGGPGAPPGPPPGGTPGGGPFLIPVVFPPLTNDFPAGWKFEFGDAPDLGLNAGYPAPNAGVPGRFPTVYGTANSRYSQPGAFILYPGHFWLGVRYSGELDADGGDSDAEPNLNVALGQSNRDYYDDGLLLPVTVNPCGLTGLHVTVNSWPETVPARAYINVLIDFNRDGEWSGAVEGAEEWAVQNFAVAIEAGREQVVPLPPFQTPCAPFPAWVRILLSDLAVPAGLLGQKDGWDGSGRFNFGEVEDYYMAPR